MEQPRDSPVNHEVTKLFGSDSETSIHSNISKNTLSDQTSNNEINYSNYSALFIKIPTENKKVEEKDSSSTFILSDYNTFKRKLSLKRSLHK